MLARRKPSRSQPGNSLSLVRFLLFHRRICKAVSDPTHLLAVALTHSVMVDANHVLANINLLN